MVYLGSFLHFPFILLFVTSLSRYLLFAIGYGVAYPEELACNPCQI